MAFFTSGLSHVRVHVTGLMRLASGRRREVFKGRPKQHTSDGITPCLKPFKVGFGCEIQIAMVRLGFDGKGGF